MRFVADGLTTTMDVQDGWHLGRQVGEPQFPAQSAEVCGSAFNALQAIAIQHDLSLGLHAF